MGALPQKKSLVAAALLAAAFLAGFHGCSREQADPLEKGLELYGQNKLAEALPLLEKAALKYEDDADVHAWVAETFRRLKKPDKAAEAARKAIELEPCSSFGHTVLAWNYNPLYYNWPGANRDMTWRHLMKAAECDSGDGNIWTGVWTEAVRRNDPAQQRRALHHLVDTGFLTDTILSYNRWMLRHLPENALLLTNGDWDTYPAAALQELEGFRPDVAVVNRSLLNVPWYAKFLEHEYGLELPYPDDEILALKSFEDPSGRRVLVATQMFQGWLDLAASGGFDRPIAVSVTVFVDDMMPELMDHLVLAGPYWLWVPEPAEVDHDADLLEASLASIEPGDFTGSFVSAMDRSPVRRTTSHLLAHNISAACLKYAESLVEERRYAEAEERLSWIERFESGTELGPVSDEMIAGLRDRIEERK
jgi:tetratricopeptide (TPR) repeat protein